MLVPLWFLWPASLVLQWRTFGPLTGQGLTPWKIPYLGAYSDKSWDTVFNGCLVLGLICMPFFNAIFRLLHVYWKGSISRALYCQDQEGRTQDPSLDAVAQCAEVPILIFGTTMVDYLRPEDHTRNAVFTFTQWAMGRERTKFLDVPTEFTLSKCMCLSSAAVDGLILGQLTWVARFLMAVANISLGDWV